MALFTETSMKDLSRKRTYKAYDAAETVLQETYFKSTSSETFDIFLSHSIKDAEVILGIKLLLEGKGLSVYVDWLVDSDLHRDRVTVSTAERLRVRMKQSKAMIYAHSNNSPTSKWMPWELGFFDGYKGVISILPIARSSDESFQGQEFLGLYPYLDTAGENKSIFVNKGAAPYSSLGPYADNNFVSLKNWLQSRANVYKMA